MAKRSGKDDFFDKYAAKVEVEEEVKKESFFTKMKNDKKYSAKVQLMGYGIFLILLVVILNVGNAGSVPRNEVVGDAGSDGLVEENTSIDNTKLLESLADNYSYDTVIDIVRESVNVETGEVVNIVDSVHYMGKSYNNTMEINKSVTENTNIYYKVDDSYYSRIDNITTLTIDTEVYNIIEGKYIEINEIIKLINKASLDHVTEYSSGKKESVYHLLVKDVVGEFSGVDVVEIKVIEENGVLTINIDYSLLFKVIYESVLECKLEVKVTDIGKIEAFEVVVSAKEETSLDGNDLDDNGDGENTSLE